jgi:hypothetical protein
MAVWAMLDNDFKRMCVLAIIHSKWVGGDVVRERYTKVEDLNRQLNLVNDSSALKFPTAIADHCFKSLPSLSEALETTDCGWGRIKRSVPCWLRYCDESAFRDDIQRVFALCVARPIVAE